MLIFIPTAAFGLLTLPPPPTCPCPVPKPSSLPLGLSPSRYKSPHRRLIFLFSLIRTPYPDRDNRGGDAWSSCRDEPDVIVCGVPRSDGGFQRRRLGSEPPPPSLLHPQRRRQWLPRPRGSHPPTPRPQRSLPVRKTTAAFMLSSITLKTAWTTWIPRKTWRCLPRRSAAMV